MLGFLWDHIEQLNLKTENKFHLFRIILEIPAGVIGLLLWLFIRIWCLKTWDWMICFIGYPVITTWLVAVLYSCRHDFHDSRRHGL